MSQQYLFGANGYEQSASDITEHAYQTSYAPNIQPPTIYPAYPRSASSYAELPFLFGVQDPTAIPAVSTGPSRRRVSRSGDQVKHRRTRSGCYTCRSRRVKCDEKKPMCERCRKGSRDCAYPEVATPQKPNSSDSTTKVALDNQGASSDEEEEYETHALSTIPDGGEDHESLSSESTPSSSQQGIGTSYSPESGILLRDNSSPTSTEDSNSSSKAGSQTPRIMESVNDDRFVHLPGDLRFYLNYFVDNLTYHHYNVKHDSGDFMANLLKIALRDEALLHALVGFSAYQHSLQRPGVAMQDFLMYYNKSVSLLLRTLQKEKTRTLGTLLTMLQLATIEETLGDWVNLFGHQKAAYEILNQLYTPETIVGSAFTRLILRWYTRFDIFAGLMAGAETVLSRDWYAYVQQWLLKRLKLEPESVSLLYEEAIVAGRLTAMDMSMLFSKVGKGEISFDTFMVANTELGKRLTRAKDNLHPVLVDPKWLVKDFTGAPPRDPDDIVDPYLPNTLYHGPLWATNQLMIDWYATNLMHKLQTSLIIQGDKNREGAMIAFAICQLFESIERWPGSPKGSLVACQAPVGIAAIFLPHDRTHHMWLRRKLATIEGQGYIYPLTFREKMSGLFQDESCLHWWLPDDKNFPPIIRSIRKFIQDRASQARDASAQDIFDMKVIFSSLKIGDTSASS